MSDHIRKYLDISTAHITQQTNDELNRDEVFKCEWTAVGYGYGFFISVPEEVDSDLPTDLQAVLNKANELGCDVVRLDSDALELEGLQTYDW